MLQIKNTLGGGSGKGLYAWKRRKVTWLYKDGDECTELTGGWSANNYNQTSYTIKQGIKNETNMSFIATNDAHTKNLLGTQKLIDPTNYSLFFVELESNEGFEVRGTINYDIGYDHDTRRFGFFPKTTTRSFSYADISKLTENLYFSLCETTYGNATVYKVGLISIEEEYITDKSPTKYPNGEVHTDGYFYRYAPEGMYVWKKCENNTDHTFIDYVVSDKETAYPDSGEKDGYYYEKVVEGITPEMFGCTKMAVDTFTLTSRTATKDYTISHSLGTKPKYFIVVYEDEPTSKSVFDTYSVMGANNNLSTSVEKANICYYSNPVSYDYTYISSISSTGFKVDKSSTYFMANVKYTVITLA